QANEQRSEQQRAGEEGGGPDEVCVSSAHYSSLLAGRGGGSWSIADGAWARRNAWRRPWVKEYQRLCSPACGIRWSSAGGEGCSASRSTGARTASTASGFESKQARQTSAIRLADVPRF